MKKIIFLLLFAVCVFTSCKDNNIYTLTGTFASGDLDGKVVYLQRLDLNVGMVEAIDSAIVENGIFVFEGVAGEKPVVLFIAMEESFRPVVFIAEKGKTEMNFDSELRATVKGTAMNDQYQLFETETENWFEKWNTAQNNYEEIKASGNLTFEQFKEYRTSSKKLEEERENIIYNFIKPHITTPAGQYFLIYNYFYLSYSKHKELIALSTPDFQQSKNAQWILERLGKEEVTAIGKPFTDVKGFDLNGNEVSLSDYVGKGKIVLIDFWASWCGPCIREMPNVMAVYNEYKDKGFEIVGISLDDNKDKWKTATGDLNITWPQMSNLKGWEEDCAVAYGVNSIPQTVLIGKDGVIIERNLDRDGLKFTLQELLKNT